MEAPSDADRLQAFAPVQEMVTYVQFANDECDYGMGLELGLDLFCHGSHVSEHPASPHTPLLVCIPESSTGCGGGGGLSWNFKMNFLK